MTQEAKEYVRFAHNELVFCHCGSGRKRGWWRAHCAVCECDIQPDRKDSSMNHDRANMSANDRAREVFDDWQESDKRSDTLERFIEQAINAAVAQRQESIAEAFAVGESAFHQPIQPHLISERIRNMRFGPQQ